MQYILVEVGLRGGRHRSKGQNKGHIPTGSVVLVQGFGIVFASIELWGVELREANQRLHDEEARRNEAENGMRRPEVGSAVRDLVVFDNDEAGDKAHNGERVESRVYVCPFILLLRSVCWLED